MDGYGRLVGGRKEPSPDRLRARAYSGLLAAPIGTWCIMEATAKLPTLVSSIGFRTTPAISLLLSNLMLGEPLTTDLLGGSALIMSGVLVTAWLERKRE